MPTNLTSKFTLEQRPRAATCSALPLPLPLSLSSSASPSPSPPIQDEAWAKREASPASCKFCVCASGPQGNEAVILSESLSHSLSVLVCVCAGACFNLGNTAQQLPQKSRGRWQLPPLRVSYYAVYCGDASWCQGQKSTRVESRLGVPVPVPVRGCSRV